MAPQNPIWPGDCPFQSPAVPFADGSVYQGPVPEGFYFYSPQERAAWARRHVGAGETIVYSHPPRSNVEGLIGRVARGLVPGVAAPAANTGREAASSSSPAANTANGTKAGSKSPGPGVRAGSSVVGDKADDKKAGEGEGAWPSEFTFGGQPVALRSERGQILSDSVEALVDQTQMFMQMSDASAAADPGASSSRNNSNTGPSTNTSNEAGPAPAANKDKILGKFEDEVQELLAHLEPDYALIAYTVKLLATFIKHAYDIVKSLTTMMVDDARGCQGQQGRDAEGGPSDGTTDKKGKSKETTAAAAAGTSSRAAP